MVNCHPKPFIKIIKQRESIEIGILLGFCQENGLLKMANKMGLINLGLPAENHITSRPHAQWVGGNST